MVLSTCPVQATENLKRDANMSQKPDMFADLRTPVHVVSRTTKGTRLAYLSAYMSLLEQEALQQTTADALVRSAADPATQNTSCGTASGPGTVRSAWRSKRRGL
eukprot:6477450-Amphidinium_carterae.1